MKTTALTEFKSVLQLLLAVLVFGTVGVLKHYIPLPPALVALIRGVLGVLFLTVFMLLTKKKFSLGALKKNLLVLLLSGICIGFNWLLLFKAVDISVSVGTLCYYTAPIFVILFSPLLLKEKLSRKFLGSFFTFALETTYSYSDRFLL